jgi:predicted Mrr-cat superfamily restriction endonuclease
LSRQTGVALSQPFWLKLGNRELLITNPRSATQEKSNKEKPSINSNWVKFVHSCCFTIQQPTLGQYSSGGADSSVLKEALGQFFKVRAWNLNDLSEPPMENYDKLDKDISAKLILKRICTLFTP